MPTVTEALQAGSIIVDILPPSTNVLYNLKVKWPTATLDKPGQMIHRDATQPCPEVWVDPRLEKPGRPGSYVLLMVDPDLTRRNDTTFGQVRHWLAAKASVNSSGQVIDLDDTISPYVGPAPVPVHYATGKPHPSRYTFILCRHKDISSDPLPNVNPDSLRSYYEGSPGDLGNPSQDIIDRMKFDTQHFIERNGLEVVAATYMLVEGNLKSAVKSVGLTAQGLGDKVVGK